MAYLGADRQQLGYKQEEGTMQLRSFIESTIVSETPEIDRIVRYELYWNFYEGKHWRMYNETLLSFNYARAFIDKIINFLVGKTGMSFKVVPTDNSDLSEDNEKLIEGFYEYHWKKNRKVSLIKEMLQMGSVTGDLWVLVGWDKENKHAVLYDLDSRHCFPNFVNGNINDLESFVLRQPLIHNVNNYKLYCIKYEKNRITKWYQKDTSMQGTVFEEKVDNNELGFIPIVHIKNKPKSSGYYSSSDLVDILKLNKTYNEIGNEINSIIAYYGTPTTVITGANVKSLRKGLGNIWSGLPPEANVFNLSLGEDLASSIEFMKSLKVNMHEIADVPENALGKIQAISNTSAAALQITYQPLIQQADNKWICYGDGIVTINKLIGKIVSVVDPKNPSLKGLPEKFWENFDVEPVFPYGLPQDRLNELQQAQTELNMKIGSRREIMNRLGKKNVPRLLEEIDEDSRNLQEIQNISFGGGEENVPEQKGNNNPKNPASETKKA